MARYLVATHTAVKTDDWLCAHCHAWGHVTVTARGQSRVRVWLSQRKAGEGAHEGAALALERDAIRIRALVRCPSCRRRAPNAAIATAWHGLPDLAAAICAGAFAAVMLGAAFDLAMKPALWLGLLAALAMVFLGDEPRRWRAARRAQVRLASRRSRAATVPAAPMARPVPVPSDGGPFRSPPAPPPIVTVAAPALPAQTPIVDRGGASDQPSLLR